MGAGEEHSQRVNDDRIEGQNNHRPQGGQAAGAGLFGLPGITGRPRRSPQTRSATQGQADDTAATVGGLTFRQRAARLPQIISPVVTAPAPLVSMEERMAAFLRKPARISAQDDTAERVSVTRYLESLERDEEERTAREGTTPTMLAFAHASDMREAFATCFEAEEAAAAGFHYAVECPAHDPALAQD